MVSISGHVADRRDQVVVQVLGAAGDVLLHQRHADALGDAALDLALDQRRVDRAADVVGGGDPRSTFTVPRSVSTSTSASCAPKA